MTTSPTAAFLKLAIANSDLTQREIAQQAELPKPNVLPMMKPGETKVPLNRIPALAKACGVDAATFIRIAMTEYHPELWRLLEAEFGANLTEDEEKLVEGWRYLTGHASTRSTFRHQKRSLASIIVELFRLADYFQFEEEKQNDLDRLLDDL
ncbi:MAG: hypothetical protein ACU0A8_01450 [Limimaricola soesokkakensis]|uniref:hypothetical protein n=1 Tax=Limimaricola soesokkakensis TaxID=1343159 RepID=UPI004059D942